MTSTKRAVAAIAGGSAGGQLIALACSPAISRLVPPGEYGPFAVVNAAVMPLASIVALRLEAAVPLPRENDEALNIVSTGLRIVAVLALVLVPAAWLLREIVGPWLGLGSDTRLLVWVPVIATLMGLFVLLNQLAIRSRMYAAIAKRNVLQAGTAALAQLAFGAAGLGAHGLALGLAIGQFVGVLALALALRPVFELRGRAPLHLGQVLARYKRFPLVMMPSALINSLGIQAPLILLAVLYGPVVSGWIGMTQRVLAIPLALIGVAIAQVFLGEFSAAKRADSDQLRALFLGASRYLLLFGLLISLVVIFAGPWIFSAVLGSSWRNSGTYARYLAMGLVFQMVASPLSQTIIVMERFGWQLAWDLGRLLLCAGVVVFARQFRQGETFAVAALGLAMAISYALLWCMSYASVVGGSVAHEQGVGNEAQ